MKEYIEREAAIALSKDIIVPQASGVAYKHRCIDPQDIRDIPAADVVEVKLLEDGTLIVTTDKYPNVTRVFVEDGKTSGSLFYAEGV